MNDRLHLDHFAAVYRHRSFRLAAESLGFSQSAVTKRVQALETALGLRLFNRTTRTVEPTDSARELIQLAENAERAVNTFREEARVLAGGTIGRIRVGAMALAAETFVVDAVARLTESHPALEVDVVVGSADIYRDLATGECDVVVGDEANFATSPHAGSLRTERIQRERLVYVHRPGHPVSRSAIADDLHAYPLAIPSRYFNENKLFEGIRPGIDSRPTPRYRLNSLSACLSLAARSDAIALAPVSLIDSHATASTQPVLEVADVDPGIEFTLVLVTVARHAMTPAVRAFRTAIRHDES